MSTCVLFIQGGGKGAHAEDTFLADSLKRALGPDYDVRYPRMPGESNPGVELWGQEISSELSKISGKVILVAHSVGGSILLQGDDAHTNLRFGCSREQFLRSQKGVLMRSTF